MTVATIPDEDLSTLVDQSALLPLLYKVTWVAVISVQSSRFRHAKMGYKVFDWRSTSEPSTTLVASVGVACRGGAGLFLHAEGDLTWIVSLGSHREIDGDLRDGVEPAGAEASAPG
jgi:hypothetical protein